MSPNKPKSDKVKHVLGVMISITCSSSTIAQPSELDIEGILNWECVPTFAAIGDRLRLQREPDLRSQIVEIPYGKDWMVPAPLTEGRTRVLNVGTLKVIEPDEQLTCAVVPSEGPQGLVVDETVEYLTKRSEGRGMIRFRGAQCVARTDASFGLFEPVELPEVQEWLRVFFADGMSPGWLLYDEKQIRLSACKG